MSSNVYGIVGLPVVAIRQDAGERYEMVTQLLFGEIYEVLGNKDGWLHIRNQWDGYEGYLSESQYISLSSVPTKAPIVSGEPIAQLIWEDGLCSWLPLGAHLPEFDIHTGRGSFNGKTYQWLGKVYDTATKLSALEAWQAAWNYWNSPYLWGGKHPLGIDCSGFTQQIWKLAGHPLLRDAYQQATQGLRIDTLEASQTADLAFFARPSDGRIIHVGIVCNPEDLPQGWQARMPTASRYILHAFDAVRLDVLDEHGIWNIVQKRHTHQTSHWQRFW
ncbi:NlpC/P60 family protein [Eisenibacter elegans]|jgi:cell wall-associated NlpC family hydrolase|uniref:C40 family peptidase n=1 Tax=Eisenibacter elegans TaxID=997 RepID=UPI00047E7524|nr:NlpC/P60 family protein [Eisenibacter elegans]